jgi:hypothetical protein
VAGAVRGPARVLRRAPACTVDAMGWSHMWADAPRCKQQPETMPAVGHSSQCRADLVVHRSSPATGTAAPHSRGWSSELMASFLLGECKQTGPSRIIVCSPAHVLGVWKAWTLASVPWRHVYAVHVHVCLHQRRICFEGYAERVLSEAAGPALA